MSFRLYMQLATLFSVFCGITLSLETNLLIFQVLLVIAMALTCVLLVLLIILPQDNLNRQRFASKPIRLLTAWGIELPNFKMSFTFAFAAA